MLFAAVITLPWALTLAGVGNDTELAGEIRTLAEFPTEYSNDFFAKVKTYTEDHAPARNFIINIGNGLSEKFDKAYEVLLNTFAGEEEEPEDTEAPTLAPDQTATPTAEPTPTPDFSDIFGDEETEAPTEPATETPTAAETPTEPAETPTEALTETPTEMPTEDATEYSAEESTGGTIETPTEEIAETPELTEAQTIVPVTATPTPTPTPTATPTATPCSHNFGTGKVIKAATCQSTGTREYTCSYCGATKTETIEKTGHSYTVLKSQTVSTMHDGYKLCKCTVCGTVSVTDIVYRTSLKNFYSGRKTLTYSGSGYKGLHNWYFYSGNDSITYLEGNNVLSEDEMKLWKEAFERLQALCDKRGIKLVVLCLPNKEQVYQEYLPSGIDLSKSDSEKRASIFAEYMKNNSSVKYIYPLQQLKTAKILYETYYQQDTHWNSVGGFVGAMQVYSAIGYQTTGIQNVEVTSYKYSGGDLVSLGVGSATEYDAYNVNYKPEVSVTGVTYYSNTTVGNNESPNSEMRLLTSNANTDKKAVIIGDSYRHAITDYIIKDFSKVYVGHRGDFNTTSAYVNENGQTKSYNYRFLHEGIKDLGEGDLLLLLAVERYDSQNVDAANNISDYIDILVSQGRW